MKKFMVLVLMIMVVLFVLIGKEVKNFKQNTENDTQTVIMLETLSYIDEEKGWF